MMVIAVAGLVANILAFWILHRGSEEKNLNVRAAALHVLGDLLGSVGAIRFCPCWCRVWSCAAPGGC